MTNKEFIKEVAEKFDVSQKHAKEMADIFEEAIMDVLERGESVKFVGVNFAVKDTPARTGRNPKTGEAVEIPEGKKVTAKLSASLKHLFKE